MLRAALAVRARQRALVLGVHLRAVAHRLRLAVELAVLEHARRQRRRPRRHHHLEQLDLQRLGLALAQQLLGGPARARLEAAAVQDLDVLGAAPGFAHREELRRRVLRAIRDPQPVRHGGAIAPRSDGVRHELRLVAVGEVVGAFARVAGAVVVAALDVREVLGALPAALLVADGRIGLLDAGPRVSGHQALAAVLPVDLVEAGVGVGARVLPGGDAQPRLRGEGPETRLQRREVEALVLAVVAVVDDELLTVVVQAAVRAARGLDVPSRERHLVVRSAAGVVADLFEILVVPLRRLERDALGDRRPDDVVGDGGRNASDAAALVVFDRLHNVFEAERTASVLGSVVQASEQLADLVHAEAHDPFQLVVDLGHDVRRHLLRLLLDFVDLVLGLVFDGIDRVPPALALEFHPASAVLVPPDAALARRHPVPHYLSAALRPLERALERAELFLHFAYVSPRPLLTSLLAPRQREGR